MQWQDSGQEAVAGRDLKQVLGELAEFTKKISQVQKICSELWDERITLYQSMFYELKKGKGIFRRKVIDIQKDCGPQTYRLETVNARETRIVLALERHQSEINSLKTRLFDVLRETVVGGVPVYSMMRTEELERLQTLVSEYFKSLMVEQKEFLHKEHLFLANPCIKTLEDAYCAMNRLAFYFDRFAKTYPADRTYGASILNIQTRLNSLAKSLDDGINACARTNNKTAEGKLSKLRAALKPYFSIKNSNIVGTPQQRISFLTTRVPELSISMMISMGIFAPLLIEATKAMIGSAPSVRITPSAEYPQFYVDFYLFFIGYVAMLMDLVPGISQTSAAKIKGLLSHLRKKLGSENPLNFSCPEMANV